MAGRALHYNTKFRAMRARNWFGDGSDGDIRITAAGAEQSFDGGITWSTISGWTVSGSTVMVPSVQDGDMVVVNSISLTIDSGYTFTTTNRCRGLLVYCLSDCVINGTLTMTARGCHANPADATVTANTPVAPSDGNAVPVEGIVVRRLSEGNTNTDTTDTLFHGCGLAAMESESNQAAVNGDGIVISIPRVGGLAGAGSFGSTNNGNASPGGTKENGTGGGGGSGGDGSVGYTEGGAGSDGTCFSGGTSGGSTVQTTDGSADAKPFGGPGGDYRGGAWCMCGVGNPNGQCGPNVLADEPAPGTAGLLLLFVQGILTIGSPGNICSNGNPGGRGPGGAGSGGTGGGIVGVFYGVALINNGAISVVGGVEGPHLNEWWNGGKGGDGSVIGPYKIDPE